MDGIIREYEARDIPVLKKIWQEAFGDSEELIDGFFELLPRVGTGFVCIYDGVPAAMSYVLESLSVNGKGCAYIYAVATKAAFRSKGFGAEVVRVCAEYARKNGCEIICTSPADSELYNWYGRLLGTECAVYAGSAMVYQDEENCPVSALEHISAPDYNRKREQLLSDTPHVSFPDGYIAIEEMICRVCGGGLYSLEDGIAVCYAENGVLKIKELLCPDAVRQDFVSALMTKHRVKAALVHSAGSLEPYIAATPAQAAKNVWWGPVLD